MVFPIKKKKSAFETAVEANKPKPAPEATVTPTGGKIRGQEELMVESDGKKYPTTNPDFRPDSNAEQITFKQGGGVEIIPVGSTTPIQLTKEEYNTSEGKAGNVTNKVQQVQAERNKAALTGLNTQDVNQQFQEQAEGQIMNAEDPTSFKGGSAGFQATAEVLSETAVAKTVLPVVANLAESLGKTFGFDIGKKSVGVTQAEQAYSDYASAIQTQIDSGANLAEIQNNIDSAIQATIDLRNQAHGLGRVGLRYWLDEGRGIEAQSERQIQQLRALQLKAIQRTLI